jgi:hypothetical protein
VTSDQSRPSASEEQIEDLEIGAEDAAEVAGGLQAQTTADKLQNIMGNSAQTSQDIIGNRK